MNKAVDARATLPVPRKYLARADREQQIVDEAIALFAQKGFALTTRELADGLQITQPLLYRYFPSKRLLIERVYEQVFEQRWNPEWEAWLGDRSRPLRERLVAYLEDYTRTILNSEWVRIFLYAGLQDPSLNQRYLERLHEQIFGVIIRELRAARGERGRPGGRQTALEYEVLWGFHSSFFYLGVRKWVYQLPVPDDIADVIAYRVDAFLEGALAVPRRPGGGSTGPNQQGEIKAVSDDGRSGTKMDRRVAIKRS